jgi:hypothetical protein
MNITALVYMVIGYMLSNGYGLNSNYTEFEIRNEITKHIEAIFRTYDSYDRDDVQEFLLVNMSSYVSYPNSCRSSVLSDSALFIDSCFRKN